MLHHDDSREELGFLQKSLGPGAYVDHIWALREAASPSLKASQGWPYVPLAMQWKPVLVGRQGR